MEIDAITADAHGVSEMLGDRFLAGGRADVLFEHGELGADAARLADVGIHGHAVLSADDVVTVAPLVLEALR